MERLVGRSLVWAEGDQHKRQRQTLAPVFTHDSTKLMDHEIHNGANKLVAALHEHVQAGLSTSTSAGTNTTQINAMDWMGACTLDIIGSIGFGYDLQLGESPQAKAILRAWRQQVDMGVTAPAFVAMLFIRAFPFITQLPVKAIQAQGEIKTTIKDLGRSIVEQRRKLEEGGEMRGKDLLSTLLRMHDTSGESLDDVLDHVSDGLTPSDGTYPYVSP